MLSNVPRFPPRPPEMTPTIAQLLSRSLPRHELEAFADADVHVVLRREGMSSPVIVGGISSRLLHVRADVVLAPAARAMLSIELSGGALRCDLPVEVVASGRSSFVLRMLAAPLVLRRRMVRDQQLSEALGVAPAKVPLVA